jgi:phage gp29-like protein
MGHLSISWNNKQEPKKEEGIVENTLSVQQAKELADGKKEKVKNLLPTEIKSVIRTRNDIKKWNDAQNLFRAEEPKNYPLQLLMDDVMLDARLTSQIGNRKDHFFSMNWSLRKPSGEIDQEQTDLLMNGAYEEITNHVLDAEYMAYSVIQLSLITGPDGKPDLSVELIPRTNIVPQKGLFYEDYMEDKAIPYREMKEFGIWILEFNSKSLGLINKAVPHVLMKRFSQSCWSELCEIYGIPPMYVTTDTSNPQMLSRAKQMMTDLGAGAKFIIDSQEKLEFAKGITTTGDVYKNLINLCDNENCLLITGSIIGQDTVNGNRSKDESSREMLFMRVKSDMKTNASAWNKIIIPALIKVGFLKGDVRLVYDPVEDLAELWTRIKDSMDNYDVDPVWIEEKFGVKILGKKEQKSLNLNSFFD